MTKRFIPLVLLPMLAACGGGSSSDGFTKSLSQIESAQTSGIEDALALFDDEGYTDLTDLPTTGSASFAGTISLSDPGFAATSPVLLGEMDAEITFRNNDVSGTAGNFFFVPNQESLSGTLDLDATLDRGADTNVEFGITGTMDGRLSANGESLDINMDVSADLVGDDLDVLGGGGIGDLDGIPLEALFVLENEG